jgi:small GTP-binding protein
METKTDVKVVLIGKMGAGKTSLVKRFIFDEFDGKSCSTIGAAYTSRKIDKHTVMSIWDTAGMERFNSLVPTYIRGAKVVLVCFESSSQQTEIPIEDIKGYINLIREVNTICDIILVATKIDSDSETPKGTYDYPHIEKYAAENKFTMVYTSALTGRGIQELFEKAGKQGFVLCEKLGEVKHLSPREAMKDACC